MSELNQGGNNVNSTPATTGTEPTCCNHGAEPKTSETTAAGNEPKTPETTATGPENKGGQLTVTNNETHTTEAVIVSTKPEDVKKEIELDEETKEKLTKAGKSFMTSIKVVLALVAVFVILGGIGIGMGTAAVLGAIGASATTSSVIGWIFGILSVLPLAIAGAIGATILTGISVFGTVGKDTLKKIAEQAKAEEERKRAEQNAHAPTEMIIDLDAPATKDATTPAETKPADKASSDPAPASDKPAGTGEADKK